MENIIRLVTPPDNGTSLGTYRAMLQLNATAIRSALHLLATDRTGAAQVLLENTLDNTAAFLGRT